MRCISSTVIGLIFATLLLAACDNDNESKPLEAELGGLTVRVTPNPARIEIIAPDGEVLWDGVPGGAPGSALAAVAVRRAEASYTVQFGAFMISEEADPWQAVTRFAHLRAEGTVITFDLVSRAGDTVGSGEIAEAGEGEVTLTLTASEAQTNRMTAAFACRPGEHFMGLGGQSFDVDHRGQTVPIWVEEDGISKGNTDEDPDLWPLMGRRHSTHTPMPIMLSNKGYALLLDTPYRSLFALCSEQEDVARVEAWEGALHLRLFYGPTPKEAITRLTAHLGRPELPPAFAFAPWLDAIYGSDNVRRVADKLRAQGVPSSVIWTEDWRGGEFDGTGYTLDEDWNVDRVTYPDFEDVADDLHSLGFKFLTYNNTFLTVGVDVWDEAETNGYTIQDKDGQPYIFMNAKFEDASLLDLSNPAAWDWAKEIYKAGLRLGSDGFMADFAEWLPTDAVLFSGEDAAAAHNVYPVEYQRLTKEVFDEMEAEDGVERLFFVRSAYLGSQPLVSVVWAGDQQTDFSEGDGLPSVIPIGIGLGVTGFPYYGHDIAGYMSQLTDPTTQELWYRWVTLGALSPVMRTHHGKSSDENWNWESDPASTAHFARWGALHIRLFPYLYGLAEQATRTGLPMMRAIALEHPGWEPGWTLTDQYLLGDRILVAPVVTEGDTQRTLQLPEGTWYPLLGGDPVSIPAGGGSVTVDAPVEECPAFVPAGTLLVLLPDGVDTLVAADATGVVTLDDVGDDRELWIWPGGDSAWTEASGLTYVWTGTSLSGAGTVTDVTWNDTPMTVDASGMVTVSGNGTLTVNSSATLELSGGDPARRVAIRFR